MDMETFVEHLKDIQEQFPRETEEVLAEHAKKLTSELKESTKISTKEHTGKLVRGWKYEMKGLTANTLEAHIFNKAPHVHLVEKGHNLVINGKSVGFVKGKFFIKSTVDANRNTIQNNIVDSLYKVLKERL